MQAAIDGRKEDGEKDKERNAPRGQIVQSRIWFSVNLLYFFSCSLSMVLLLL